MAMLALTLSLIWKRDPPTAIPVVTVPASNQLAIDGASAITPGAMPRSNPAGLSTLPSAVKRRLAQRTPEQIEADRTRRLALLEAQFKNDRADPVDSTRTERALEDVLTSSTMKSTGMLPSDVTIDCKVRSCRIVGSFARRSDAEDWSMFYLTASAQQLSNARMVLVPGANGSAEVHLYATRGNGR